jgi:hypothetical protein
LAKTRFRGTINSLFIPCNSAPLLLLVTTLWFELDSKRHGKLLEHFTQFLASPRGRIDLLLHDTTRQLKF